MSSGSDLFFKETNLPFIECRFTRESSRNFKPHLHHSFCVGAVVEGEVEFCLNNTSYLLKRDTLALINPECLHSCNSQIGNKRSFYMAYLDKGWCCEIQKSLWRNEAFIPVDIALLQDTNIYLYYLQTMESLRANVPLMEKEQRILMLIETIFARCCPPNVPVCEPVEFLEELKEWLGADLESDITLESFANSRRVNSYTLLRHFKNSYGVTPHAYRLNCRVEYGRKLLRDGVDIADCAYRSGFFDQSHFHRHFKAITSVTPKEYQKGYLLNR